MSVILGLLGFTLFLSSQRGQPAPAIRLAGPTYDGVTFSMESADLWTPTSADVREAESLLSAYLLTPAAARVLRGTRIPAELRDYKRQYWGLIRQKEREIFIHFYHQDTPVVRTGKWLLTTVSVAGGGDQYFHVVYDVQRKTFRDLRVNAPE